MALNNNFKPAQLTTLPKIREPLTPEVEFWKKSFVSNNLIVKEYGSINAVDIHPINDDVLVTSSSRVSLYNFNSLEQKRWYKNHTPGDVYSGSFRKSDGKLFVSSSKTGAVFVHDINEPKPLRIFANVKTKHSDAVQKCQFINYSTIVSFSDDKTIKVWDIGSSECVKTIGTTESPAHGDFIRAGCVQEETELIISGSYDHTVKIWDARGDATQSVQEFDVEYPVESVITKESLVIACGQKVIVVYDMIAGKVMSRIRNMHSKAISSLVTYDKYLLSGSLDGHIRIYDNVFKSVTTIKEHASQISNVIVNDKGIVTGYSDGTILIKKFKSGSDAGSVYSEPAGNKRPRYFNSAMIETGANQAVTKVFNDEQNEDEVEHIRHKRYKSQRLEEYDTALKKFEHSKALNLALKKHSIQHPEKVVSLMQELTRRSALNIALSGRTDKELEAVIVFLTRNIRDPKFNRILIDIAIMLVEIYTPLIDQSAKMTKLFKNFEKVVNSEIMLMQGMKMLAGQLAMVIENS